MKEKLKILLIGRGGREGALAAKILKSPRTEVLLTLPGEYPGAIHKDISSLDFENISNLVQREGIDLVVVGPEAPIVAGIKDALSPLGVKVIAPDKECARLEGSKEFAKEFMISNAIPSPRFMSVTADTLDEGLGFLDSQNPPYVLKADGLAAGRGVLIIDNLDEAKATLRTMIEGLFGDSSTTTIVEEFVEGPECSLFFAIDGEDYKYLGSARDYKRLEDGDKGLNTAGLGAISPALSSECDSVLVENIEKRILLPTLRGLKEEGMEFQGFLYLGVKDVDGEPVLLEYNVRLGDPETQVIIPRLQSDIVDLFEGIADRTLALKKVSLSPLHSAGIVLAATGYPSNPRKGDPIEGLEAAAQSGATVYTGAVRKDSSGQLLTDGGRVVTVVAVGESSREAAEKAYQAADKILFEGKYCRTDIGR